MDFIDIIGTLFDNSINHVVAIANLIKDLRLNKNLQDINEDLYEQIRISKETKEKCKGYYDSYDLLSQQIEFPEVGDWAIVKKSDGKWYIYDCIVKDTWRDTELEYTTQEINLTNYTKRTDFKTINEETILGEGNIQIKGPKGDPFTYEDFTPQLLSDMVNQVTNNITNYVFVDSLPEASINTMNKTYIVVDYTASNIEPSNDVEEFSNGESYITIEISNIPNNLYYWVHLGQYRRKSVSNITYNSSTEKLLKTIAGETTDVLDLKDKLVRHIFLTESEYRLLQNKDENTLYFITEDEEVHSSGSRLGEDTFPFTLE